MSTFKDPTQAAADVPAQPSAPTSEGEDSIEWWHGNDAGVAGAALRWEEALTEPIPKPGVMREPLESLYRRTEALRDSLARVTGELEDTKTRNWCEMVQRYAKGPESDPINGMVCSHDGHFVKRTDFLAAIRERDEARAKLDDAYKGQDVLGDIVRAALSPPQQPKETKE